MRLKLLLGMVGFGALAMGGWLLLSSRDGATSIRQPSATASAEVAPLAKSQSEEPAGLTGPPAQPLPTAQTNAEAGQPGEANASADAAKHEAYVAARIAELQDLSRKTDAAALETLLSEIKNPDPEIRQAALDALSQSGNRNAIPGLQEAATQTEDAAGKQAIEEVIEFLKLPTLTELLNKQAQTNHQNVPPKVP